MLGLSGTRVAEIVALSHYAIADCLWLGRVVSGDIEKSACVERGARFAAANQ